VKERERERERERLSHEILVDSDIPYDMF